MLGANHGRQRSGPPFVEMSGRAADPETAWVGRSAKRTFTVSEALVDRFVELSGDRSAIHVSDAAAVARGFTGRVAHGMLLGALTSAVLGTELPGDAGILQTVELAFRQPCYVGDRITVHVAARELFASVATLVLDVRIVRDDGTVLATGSVRSGVPADA